MNYKMADKLIELRKRKGLSQDELANHLNISRQAVSKWERAESYPDTENLIALAKLYNVSLDEIVNDDNTNAPTKDKQTHINIISIPINRKKALNIVSLIFLILGIIFTLMGSGFYLGFALPETLDLKLAQDQSIAPVSAEVTHTVKTSVSINSDYKYKIAFSWLDGDIKRTAVSNAVYSQTETDALVGNNIAIKINGNRAVMVDYQRSALSIIGFVFIGVFGGLGILFIITFATIFTLNKKY